MLSSPHEVQYVALRNINLILQKRNDILSNEIRVFFCKYNDPPYVKMEKLEILIKLVDERNVDQFISEMKEYASEVDVEFVRKSVEAIGRCAIKIEAAAERCVNALLDLIKNKVNYVVQETIIVVKVIRLYVVWPNCQTLYDRIYSASIPIATSPSFPHSVRTWSLWMSQMPKLQ